MITVSYSELSTFRQCPLKHHLTYKLRYTKPPSENSALVKGTLWHWVLEVHYRIIKKHQDEHKGKLTKAARSAAMAEIHAALQHRLWPRDRVATENEELVAWMYMGYLDKYGLDEQWRVKAVEHAVFIMLPNEDGSPGTDFQLKAKIDLIVWDHELQQYRIVDHKSCGDLPHEQELAMDDQFGLYEAMLEAMGKPVHGTIHSAARTKRNKGDYPGQQSATTKPQTLEQRFLWSPMNRAGIELRNIIMDAANAARAAYPNPDDPLAGPRYSSPDPRSCGWKCDVMEPHLAMRKGVSMANAMADWGFVIDRTRH